MVRIDKKIREVVNQIKEEEARIATLSSKIEDAAPKVSVATQEKATIAEIVLSHKARLHFIKI